MGRNPEIVKKIFTSSDGIKKDIEVELLLGKN